MVADLILDLILLSAILGLGTLLTVLLIGRWDFLWIGALAFPIGSGVLTWLAFVASWIGLRIDLSTVAIIYLGVLIPCLVLLARGDRRRGGTTADWEPPASSGGRTSHWLALSLGTVAVLWLASSLFLSVARSYSVWDALAIWSVKGYGIAREGSIFAALRWGGHGLSYPLNLPILISLFDLAGGDTLPGSKMIFPVYFASLTVGIYGFSRRIGLGTAVAALSALFVASIPRLFTESTTGYANAPFTVYLVLGGVTFLEGALAASSRKLILGGLLLGLAGWTRIEGPIYAIAILAAGMVGLAIAGRFRVLWAWALPPMVVLWLPWVIFYRSYGAGGSQAMGALSAALAAFQSGSFRLGPLRVILEWIVQSALDSRAWGYVWMLAIAVGILRFRSAPPTSKRAVLTTAAMAGAAILVTALLFYIGSFRVAGLRAWLDRSFERFFLPGPTLFFVALLWLLVPPPGGAHAGGIAVGQTRGESEPGPPS